jgi:hypothetical protein
MAIEENVTTKLFVKVSERMEVELLLVVLVDMLAVELFVVKVLHLL